MDINISKGISRFWEHKHQPQGRHNTIPLPGGVRGGLKPVNELLRHHILCNPSRKPTPGPSQEGIQVVLPFRILLVTVINKIVSEINTEG